MNDFTPQNIVQELASKKRGITDQAEFQRNIKEKPYNIPRVTARYWWVHGVPESMQLQNAKTLAAFLRVKIDDLIRD